MFQFETVKRKEQIRMLKVTGIYYLFFFFCRAMYDLLKIPNIFFLFSTAAPCSGNTYFCHSNMCINNSLVCNGIQNCAYPWDENHCRGEYSAKYSLYNPGCSVAFQESPEMSFPGNMLKTAILLISERCSKFFI